MVYAPVLIIIVSDLIEIMDYIVCYTEIVIIALMIMLLVGTVLLI